MYTSCARVAQGGLGLVAPGRISNKKYDRELLSDVTLHALTVQGVKEAYDWLASAVAESDIPVGAAVEAKTPPGAMGPLHACGAGQRIANVQLILPSPDKDDPEKFWAIPADGRSQPIVHDAANPLPKVRYKNPSQVPAHMQLVTSDSDDADDSDNQPLMVPVQKRQRAPSKKQVAKSKPPAKRKAPAKRKSVKKTVGTKKVGAKQARTANARQQPRDEHHEEDEGELWQPTASRGKATPSRKRRRTQPADEQNQGDADPSQSASLSDLGSGMYTLTHDLYPPEDEEHEPRPGFSVCQLVSDNQGTQAGGCWRYKHMLSSVDPWKKSILRAKFGVGRGRIVDGGTNLIPAWSIIAAWRGGLSASGKLPASIQVILQQHSDWASLED
jgi:hypothetical protein